MSVHLTCCVDDCAIEFCLPQAVYDRRREDHKVFFCPNGHEQHFVGPSAKEKKIKVLEQRVEWRDRRIGMLERERDELLHEVRSLRSRLSWARRKAAA